MAAQQTTDVEQSGFSFFAPKPFNADVAITGKEQTLARSEPLAETAAMTSQTIVYTFFTCRRSLRGATTIRYFSGATAAATVTTIQYGLYKVVEVANELFSTTAVGDLALVASTPNDATLLTATNTAYPKATSAAFDLKAGKRYAVALLVNATTPPTVQGRANPTATVQAIMQEAPKRSAQWAGQTSLANIVTVANQAASPHIQYAQLF